MASLAKLTVQLEAQTAKYQRELEKANRKLDRFARNQQRQIKKMSQAFRTVGIAIATAFGARAINAMRGLAVEAAAAADEVGKQSDVLGIATEKLVAYQLAARLSGSSNAALEKGIQKLQKSIADANNGLSTYTRAFDQLGLKSQDLARLSPDQQFEALAKAFVNLETQTQKVGVAYDLFGGRNTRLLKVLELVGTEMNALEADTLRWGLALDRFEISNIEAARDSMEKASSAVDGLATQLSLKLAPAIEDVANRFSQSISKSDGFFASIGAFLASGTNSPEKRVEQLRREIERLENRIEIRFQVGLHENVQAEIDQKQAELEATLDRIATEKNIDLQLRVEADLVDEIRLPEPAQISEKTQRAFAAVHRSLDAEEAALVLRFKDMISTVEDEVAADLELFGLVDHLFSEDDAKLIRERIRSALPLDGELIPELTIETENDRILRPEQTEDVEELQRTTDEFFENLLADTADAQNAVRELGLTFTSAFEEAILSGNRLSDVLKGLAQDLLRLFVRKSLLEPFLESFSGLFNTGGTGGSGGANFGDFFRADGGPVTAGSAYVVGEDGAELFVPSVNGEIIPNDELRTMETTARIEARELGGEVKAGRPYLVGEAGPELFTPRAAGNITPNSELTLGGVEIVNNFHPGSDAATIQTHVLPLLERSQRDTLAQVHDERRQGLL